MRAIISLILVLLVCALAGWLPFESHDVAELEPVQTLLLTAEQGKLCLQAEGGECGTGASWDEAVQSFLETSDGAVFLQTAETVILKGDLPAATQAVVEARTLRPATGVYYTQAELDLEQITEYLHLRGARCTVSKLRAFRLAGLDAAVPRLALRQGRPVILDA